MPSAHEQRFLREGGLGTSTSILDVPCDSTHRRDVGARRHSSSIRSHCCAGDNRSDGGSDGGSDGDGARFPLRMQNPLESCNSKSYTTLTNPDVAVF
jgi:hypothetical protein